MSRWTSSGAFPQNEHCSTSSCASFRGMDAPSHASLHSGCSGLRRGGLRRAPRGRTGHRLLALPRRHTLLAPAVGWRLVWRQQAVARGLFSTVRCGWVRMAYAEVVEHLTPTPQDEASVSWLTCSIPRASQRLHRSRHRCVRTALFALLATCRKGCASIITKALVGFQGRGCADGVPRNCGHPSLLNTSDIF